MNEPSAALWFLVVPPAVLILLSLVLPKRLGFWPFIVGMAWALVLFFVVFPFTAVAP
jgi:hypothetical protein